MSATPLAGTSPRIKTWDLRDLVEWDLKIRDKADEFGLDCYPQEFELCDHNGMLGYMAYSGMPSHYPHWSYGKSYEKLKTLYDHGVSGLPYEMVINSNPAIAYLMRDNSLLLHILTIAHVYGHNDFFKNNFTFKSATRAELTIESFKAAAMRVRRYVEDPSIGVEKVERILDAAHALSWQCRRNFAIKKLSPFEQMARAEDTAQGSARSVSENPRAQDGRGSRLPQGPARARRRHPALHPRSQSVPRRLRKRSAHHRRSGSQVLHLDDGDEDHERGMGELLAQEDSGIARPRPGAAPRIHRESQPGRAARFPARSTRTTSDSSFGKTSIAATRIRPPRKSSATASPRNPATRKSSRFARSSATRRSCAGT